MLTGHGQVSLRADPFAFATEVPPATASIVTQSQYEWQDGEWFAARASTDLLHAPVSIYECHLGSWRLVQHTGGGWRPLTYREAAEVLPGTWPISASPTWSSPRSRSTRSPAPGGTR